MGQTGTSGTGIRRDGWGTLGPSLETVMESVMRLFIFDDVRFLKGDATWVTRVSALL